MRICTAVVEIFVSPSESRRILRSLQKSATTTAVDEVLHCSDEIARIITRLKQDFGVTAKEHHNGTTRPLHPKPAQGPCRAERSISMLNQGISTPFGTCIKKRTPLQPKTIHQCQRREGRPVFPARMLERADTLLLYAKSEPIHRQGESSCTGNAKVLC